jgi:ABC-type multidrug transport system fused ATPase/permease subunit
MKGWLRDTRALAWVEPLGIRRWHLVASTSLALLMAVLDGASIGLLVPIAQGVVSGDFASATEVPIVGPLADWGLRQAARFDAGSPLAPPLIALAAIAFLVAMMRSVVAYGSYVFAAYWQGTYEQRAHVFALERYLRFGKQYFDEINRGEAYAVLGYVGDLIDSIKQLRLIVVDLLTLLAYVAVMLWISPWLTAFVVIVFPVVHGFLRWVVGRIRRASEAMNRATLEHHGTTQNILSSLALFRTFGAERRVRDQFDRSRGDLRRIDFRINVIQGLITPAQELLALVIILALIALAAIMVGDRGAAQFAGFLVFLYVVRMALPRLTAMQERLTTLAMRRPSLAELGDLLEDEGKHIVPDGDRTFEGLQEAIEFRDLSFQYVPGVPVLRDVTLRFARGQKTALVGPSGAGKSTVVQLLLRFYDVPPGTLLVDGVDLRSFRSSSFRARLAVVPQEVLLFNDTLRANLLVGAPTADDRRLVEALERTRLDDLLAKLPAGLDTRLGDDGVRLSGGQRQRVAICRALLRDPEILILDEATSALDSATEARVQQSLEELLAGRTSIVIAHRAATVTSADHVIVLRDGTVIESGPPAQLLAAGGYLAGDWGRAGVRADTADPRAV